MSISNNLLFVVNVEVPHVKTVKNLPADDMGAWHGTGTKTFFFKQASKKTPLTKVTEEMFEPLVYSNACGRFTTMKAAQRYSEY